MGRIHELLIVTVMGSAVAGCGGENQDSHTTNTPTNIETSSSIESTPALFRSKYLDYTLIYSPDWRAETRSRGAIHVDVFTLNPEKENPPTMYLSYQTLDTPRTLEQITEDQLKVFKEDKNQSGEFIFRDIVSENGPPIDGTKSSVIKATDYKDNQTYTVFFVLGTRIWSAHYTASDEDFETNLPTIITMLESFHMEGLSITV